MMMHIGFFPFAVALVNLSTNVTALEDSGRTSRALTTKKSMTKPPAKGKSWLVRRVAETTSEVQVYYDRLVKQGQPIAKLDSRDYQVALAQAKAGFERAKAQFAQSQARLIEADAQLKQAQVQAKAASAC
jgi:multidrug efflux pump subunit AcrA (membrane-fusion protein)